MRFTHRRYVPCLRWKQGEYLAVQQLSETARATITPLIEVPEMPFDFETWTASRTIDEHLRPLARRVKEKWGTAPFFLDVNYIPQELTMNSGEHPAQYALDSLRALECTAIPVTRLTPDNRYQRVLKRAVAQDRRGLCMRIGLQDAASKKLSDQVRAILTKNSLTPRDSHLILDLEAPNFIPIDGFARLIGSLVRKLPHLSQWRSLTLLGTAFPESMAGIPQGATPTPRHEWALYKAVAKDLTETGTRAPAFGDYCINHPRLLPQDMRKLKPSATIRYTTADSWLVVKGRNFRDHGGEQYRGLCRIVTSSSDFAGASFSAGDQYIADCAAGTGKTGNLSKWRQVGTNHHLELIARDLATLFEIEADD